MGGVPRIELTPRALSALRRIAAATDSGTVRLRISSHFRHSLDFDRQRPRDIVLRKDVFFFVLDPISASRADGITIDFVDDGEEGAFKIDNPKQPPRLRSIAPPELKRWLDTQARFELFDVRPADERAIAVIEGSSSFESEGGDRLGRLDRAVPLVVYCRDGLRSEALGRHCLRLGFREVYSLEGGIDRWAEEIDPSLPRYRA